MVRFLVSFNSTLEAKVYSNNTLPKHCMHVQNIYHIIFIEQGNFTAEMLISWAEGRPCLDAFSYSI
jgi:hypothetical protein